MRHKKKFTGNFHQNQTQKTNFWRKLLRKSHKNQTQKTKFLEENAAKLVPFEKKTFFNFCSIFIKKKKTIFYTTEGQITRYLFTTSMFVQTL